MSKVDWRGPAGKLSAEEADEVSRILEGATVRPHEMDDAEAVRDTKPEMRPIVELDEIARILDEK